MATAIRSRRLLPICNRVFEFSRLNEDWMSGAYALVVPPGPARMPSPSPSPEQIASRSIPDGSCRVAEGGRIA
jgi:hypothetical protein